MALSTNHLSTEEDLCGVGHVVQGHSRVSHVVAHGTIVPGITFSRDELSRYFVERHVLPDGIHHPNGITYSTAHVVGSTAS